jgi:1A family penicillin-binding protein
MRIYSYQSHSSKTPSQKSKTPKLSRPTGRRRSLKEWWKSLSWKQIGTWSFRIGAGGVLALAILFIYVSFSLPDPNRLLGRDVPQSTKIYDREDNLLYEVHGEFKRTLINLDQMSPFVQKATIATEDKDFYNHAGISITGTLRSLIVDIVYREKRQGGSTITQQFIKNAVLTNEKSIWRKVKEIILALEIEARFSKNDILKLYLNEIPYGRNAYGIEAASQTYFAKSAKDLTIAESAYLAALPQAPTYYNPNGTHRDALEGRKDYILGQMKTQGYITEEQYNEASNEKVVFKSATNSITAPYFVFYIEEYIAEKYGERTLEEGGLKVHTTLDSRLQEIAEKTVKEGIAKVKSRNANNAALVAIDPKTGQILAMVGGKDYFGNSEPAGCVPGKNCVFEPNVNVATSARQPGSSFKPYVYLTAFGKDFKYSPASMLMDVVTDFGSYGGKDYQPRNYNNQSYGPVSMRKALAGSLNVPAVKTLALVGVDNAVQTAHDLGVSSPLQNCGLSLVLGGCEVKLVDHVAAFAAIANEGDRHQKTGIMKVEDQEGKVLEEYKDQSQQVVDPQAAYELINIMTDNPARSFIFGGNAPLTLPDRQLGCKTGTTQNWHDGWTLCFTPSIAAGVWAGNNDGTLLKAGSDGVVVAAPILNAFLKEAVKGTPAEDFKIPNGITKVTVDSVSGKLPNEYSPETKTEVFADYAVPTDTDKVHVGIKIDTTTGQRATDLTSPDNIALKVYTVFHSEKPDTPNWENPVVAWALANGFEYPSGEGPVINDKDRPKVSITSPDDGAVISDNKLNIKVAAESDKGIAKVIISIDGEVAETLTEEPYNTTVKQNFSDGTHTITARAVDKNGISNDTSTIFVVGEASNALSMTDPNPNANVNFPLVVAASSNALFSSVSFYYQSGGGSKLIGTAQADANFSAPYSYSFTWNTKPPAGVYKLYAKNNKGDTSAKINITVP